MVDNSNNGVEIEEITLEEYEEAELFRDVRQACTLHYNQIATSKTAGDNLVFTNDSENISVPLSLDAAKKALDSTTQENLATYGIPNEEIEIGIEESQKPADFEFLNEQTL